jgi:uncharacterized membrane protein YjjP (DUF1212 family)
MNLVEILEGAHVALRIIQTRLVLLVCMGMAFGLFCWAMWLGTVLGCIVAATWGLIVFLPVLYSQRRGASDGVQEAPQHADSPAPPQ